MRSDPHQPTERGETEIGRGGVPLDADAKPPRSEVIAIDQPAPLPEPSAAQKAAATAAQTVAGRPEPDLPTPWLDDLTHDEAPPTPGIAAFAAGACNEAPGECDEPPWTDIPPWIEHDDTCSAVAPWSDDDDCQGYVAKAPATDAEPPSPRLQTPASDKARTLGQGPADDQGQQPAPFQTAAHPPPQAGRTATFYIDADNQLPNCAHALVQMSADLALGPLQAIVAGNNCNGRLDGWCEELRWSAPAITLERIQVPARRQAADVALIMALGANLAEHLARQDLLVIVSRDESLISAAEWAKAKGCASLTAYSTTAPPGAQDALLPSVLLPVLDRPLAPPKPRAISSPPASVTAKHPVRLGPAATKSAPPPPIPAKTSATPPAAPAKPTKPAKPITKAQEVMTILRAQCKLTANGGYSANEIGQALQKLGYDAKARRQFLSQTPGISVVGKGTNKCYIF